MRTRDINRMLKRKATLTDAEKEVLKMAIIKNKNTRLVAQEGALLSNNIGLFHYLEQFN
jgi:hypothetical protein